MDQNLFDIPIAKSDSRKKVAIPFCDVDDFVYNTRHDPNFIASITNLMQVPSTITLTNGNSMNMQRNTHQSFIENGTFSMDIPEKLTADAIIKNRNDYQQTAYSPSEFNALKEIDSAPNINDVTATPPSTPTKDSFLEKVIEEEKFSKTPQISEDLFNRMRPRRSSLDVDLQTEIRMLRDKINILEHECQVNSRSCKVFYAILCGYVLLKTFSWLVNTR